MPAFAASAVDGARCGTLPGVAAPLHPPEPDTMSDDGVSSSSGSERAGCYPQIFDCVASSFCMVAQAGTHSTAIDSDQNYLFTASPKVTRTDRSAAERRALDVLTQRQLDGRPFTHADLWSVLSLWRCKRSAGQGTLPRRGTAVPSDTFGLVQGIASEGPSSKTWRLSDITQKYPSVCKLVNSFLTQQLTAEQNRRFRFPRSFSITT